jgi:SNF family Na+-dependent transporter
MSVGELGGILFLLVFVIAIILVGVSYLLYILPGDVTRNDDR